MKYSLFIEYIEVIIDKYCSAHTKQIKSVTNANEKKRKIFQVNFLLKWFENYSVINVFIKVFIAFRGILFVYSP